MKRTKVTTCAACLASQNNFMACSQFYDRNFETAPICSSSPQVTESYLDMMMMSLLLLLLLFGTNLVMAAPKTVGPDLVARSTLLRDLPISRTLSGAMRVIPRPRNRTLIDMSLSVHSINLDYATGTPSYIQMIYLHIRHILTL
jgi:hypothetical protein